MTPTPVRRTPVSLAPISRAPLRRALLRALLLGGCLGPLARSAPAADFDPTHAAWTTLLERHVRWIDAGHASRVDYAGLAGDRAALRAYLDTLTAVPRAAFDRYSRSQRLAFLINAYNAFTVEKVLSRYPDLRSIRDFGRVFGNPWKDRFFTLLGLPRTLDEIEHELIRAPGAFDEPRIHVALNCASIGCPALRPQAYQAEALESQFEDAMRRFMGDRSRNRYDPQSGSAQLSAVFDWYGVDFTKGHGGFSSLQDLLSRYAELLADAPADRQRLRGGGVPIRFLPYDWNLNDSAR
jgi:hypothetical protein